MPNYLRAVAAGGTFFLTIATYQRRPLFAERGNVERLREAIRAVRAERPFEVVAAVVLPDHLHFIWTLPEGDSDFSWRVGRMKFRRARYCVPFSSTRRARWGGTQ